MFSLGARWYGIKIILQFIRLYSMHDIYLDIEIKLLNILDRFILLILQQYCLVKNYITLLECSLLNPGKDNTNAISQHNIAPNPTIWYQNIAQLQLHTIKMCQLKTFFKSRKINNTKDDWIQLLQFLGSWYRACWLAVTSSWLVGEPKWNRAIISVICSTRGLPVQARPKSFPRSPPITIIHAR